MEGNEENTPHPLPLYVKGLKIRLRKSVRGQPSRGMPSYDSGREESDEEGEADEEDEDAETEEEEEIDAMLPLGH